MDVITASIDIAILALWAIILWFVCQWLPIPENAKRVCQILIALMAILASMKIIIGTPVPMRGLSDKTPSIITPERR